MIGPPTPRAAAAIGRWIALALLALPLSACATPPATEQSTPEDAAAASAPGEQAPVEPTRGTEAAGQPAVAPSRPAAATRATPSPAPASTSASQTAAFLRLGAAMPADRALTPEDFQPATSATQRWVVVEGDGVGDTFVRTLAATDREGASLADRWGEETTLLLARGADGSLRMPATISHRDRALSLFEPALLMCPPRLEPATPTTDRTAMRVVDDGRPENFREKGTATRRIELLDRVEIDTPRGTRLAYRVRIEFRARLQFARATEIAEQFVVPGEGIVAESRREEIVAMGLFGRRTEQTVVRVE